MYETRPALVLGSRRRMAHRSLFVIGVLGLVLLGASVWLLVSELRTGRHGVGDYWGFQFPAWMAVAVGIPILAIGVRDTFLKWRQTGRDHGLVDYVEDPQGLVLVHHRLARRRQTLLVQRGEPLDIGATLTAGRPRGRKRTYRFVVTAPGGSFVYSQDGWIERYSLAPLDAAAHQLGIIVTTSGAADVIARLTQVV
ncbi:hypothetical protein ACPPVS_17015 [Cellulomonas sp. McL0617]|uniref:hypothetical protein n=1 Tax=Cellulomonas sp. McL0617 TaxID=3415675 RepID=UPI003CFA0F9A